MEQEKIVMTKLQPPPILKRFILALVILGWKTPATFEQAAVLEKAWETK